VSRDRKFSESGHYFLKTYNDPDEAEYEYTVLERIERASPVTFSVPRPLKLVKGQKKTVLVMERVEGDELQTYINGYLLFKNNSAVMTFSSLGRALRELHTLNMSGLRSSFLPASELKMKEEIGRLARRLPGLVAPDVAAQSNMNGFDLDEKLFKTVNLHGESYFSHIMTKDGKFVFLDFHKACRGPAFYDLATFDMSLYGSLLLPARSARSLDPLIDAFWKGYLHGEPHRQTTRAGETYVALRALEDLFLDKGSLKGKIVNSLKIRKLQKIVREVIF